MNILTTILISFISGILTGIAIISVINITINLPKEYKQISKDHHKPDTLLGFYIDNKLHIEFKPKTK